MIYLIKKNKIIYLLIYSIEKLFGITKENEILLEKIIEIEKGKNV